MTSNATIASVTVAAVPPVTGGSSTSGEFRGSKSAENAEKASRYRLVIEEGPQSGSFIYKTMDRVTGEVIRQFPREQVVQMMQSERYDAGAVIDTTV